MQGGQKWKGKTFSEQHRARISRANKRAYKNGRHPAHGWNTSKCFERIEQEIPELEKQGFKCIPIGRIVPDMIALKDGKIYAIEVEYGKPDYDKYSKNNYREKFDGVLWILRGKRHET